MKYQLTGAEQEGLYKDKSRVLIRHGEVIIPVMYLSLWQRFKSFITGYRWYYFENSNDRLFLVHDSIIDRYFEEVR